MSSRHAILWLGIMALAPLTAAQGFRAGPPPAGPGFGVHFHGWPQRAVPASSIWLGAPYWYADYTPQPAPATPEVVIVQPQPSSTAQPEAKLPEPLMIELQGDHYVRLHGADAAQTRADETQAFARAPSAPPLHRALPSQQKVTALAPVVLIFRDGHRAEVSEYTIVDGTIYARGDYWTDGYWEEKIQLSSLDVPATMKVNDEHGVKFVLPSAPNEVVMRP